MNTASHWPYVMYKQHHAELVRRFPRQFLGDSISQARPDGWHGIVEQVCLLADSADIPVFWIRIKARARHYVGHTLTWDAGGGQ